MMGPLEGLSPYDQSDVIAYALQAPHALLAELNTFTQPPYDKTRPESAERIMRRDVFLRLQWGRMMFDEIEGKG